MKAAGINGMPVDEGASSSAAQVTREEKRALFPLLPPGPGGDFVSGVSFVSTTSLDRDLCASLLIRRG